MNNADYLRQTLLVHSLAPPRLQNEVGSGHLASWVVTKERKEAWPLGHNRLSFVPLPTFVNFPQRAYPFSHILLLQTQRQSPIAKVLAKGHRLGHHAFLLQNERL